LVRQALLSTPVQFRDAPLQRVERANLVRREGAIEAGEVVEQADVVASPEANTGLLDVPGEPLSNRARRALVLGVEVQACPTRLGRVEAVPGDRDVSPLSLGEWWLRDLDEAEEELLASPPLAGGIPLALVPEAPEPEVRRVVLGEVGPDAGVAVVLVGELEGVAVALGDLRRVDAHPE